MQLGIHHAVGECFQEIFDDHACLAIPTIESADHDSWIFPTTTAHIGNDSWALTCKASSGLVKRWVLLQHRSSTRLCREWAIAYTASTEQQTIRTFITM
jgi:hypothetical protein